MRSIRRGSTAPSSVARALWPRDEATIAILQRAATAPHSTASAAALATSAVGEFLGSLASLSAGASLFAAAPHVSLEGIATVNFPRRANAIDANAVVWIDEGAPSRMPQLTITAGVTLGPAKKLMAIAVASRELVESSDGETVLDLLLRESASFSLDASVFSADAATSAKPAGLLNGISAQTDSAATDESTAMATDQSKLAQAISAVTSGSLRRPSKAGRLDQVAPLRGVAKRHSGVVEHRGSVGHGDLCRSGRGRLRILRRSGSACRQSGALTP